MDSTILTTNIDFFGTPETYFQYCEIVKDLKSPLFIKIIGFTYFLFYSKCSVTGNF